MEAMQAIKTGSLKVIKMPQIILDNTVSRANKISNIVLNQINEMLRFDKLLKWIA